jgi:CDP-diacylglycerol--glycerol-3-phosphate 3-phosphatidyltransferase
MNVLDSFLNSCRDSVRTIMRRIAAGLNHLTRGKLSPNTVTFIGLGMHLPIAWLIAQGYFGYAAIGLVVFGLFDTLDGELARLQNKASPAGMVLDASTDRMKEVLLYCGAAYALIQQNQATYAVWAVAACGASLCVSYVKAKGETAVKDRKLSANQINRLFQDGLLRFEVRMFLLVVGLLIGELAIVLVIIAVLSTYTALDRLAKITRALS